jgi:hypothetical protein
MRRTNTSLLRTTDGKLVEATIITSPNIDDIVITEAKVQAYNIWKGNEDPDRRTGREVRDILLRFGVQR